MGSPDPAPAFAIRARTTASGPVAFLGSERGLTLSEAGRGFVTGPRSPARASRRTPARPRRSPRRRPAPPAPPPPARASRASAGLAAASITRFASPTARGAQASSSFASASVAASSSSAGAIRFAKPIRCASRPSMTLPVMISSLALPSPTTAGSREQPPTSGSRPTRTSMIPATASSAIVRKSHASASSNAPPSAAPWIWQIVGFGISSSRFHQLEDRAPERRAGSPGSRTASRRSFRSMPGREHRPLAAHDHHPHRVVGRGGLDRRAERANRLAVQGIALLGPVEHQVADRAAVFDEYECHGVWGGYCSGKEGSA